MANSLKLSDNLYWDATGVIVRTYTSSGNNVCTEAITSSRTLQADSSWIDCGGFMYSDSSLSRKVVCNSGANWNQDVSFGMTFSRDPTVVCCCAIGSDGTDGSYGHVTASVQDITASGFSAKVANNATKNFGVSYFWIAVGK